MNICIFTDTYLPDINGVAVSCNSLYKCLKKRGHNVYVCTNQKENDVTFENDVLRIPGLELKKLYGYKLSGNFNKKAYDILKKLNLDIVHINTEYGVGQFGFQVAQNFKIPAVYTYHTMYEDYTYYGLKGYLDRFSKWTVREFYRESSLKANEIISPSEKTKNYLRSIGNHKHINIIPTGFDFTRFERKEGDEAKVLEIKKEYNIPSDRRILLCLGRLAHEKSFDVLIRAYRKYIDEYKDEKSLVLVVGSGPEEQVLRDLAKELKLDDYVLFIGKVDNSLVPYFYFMADLFLNASITETQGLTFMEAMSARVPILCRFDNSLVGVVNNNVNGFFFQDENDFKERLTYVLSIDKNTMEIVKDNALKSIEKYSEKTFYENVIEVYNRAIRRNW